MSYLDSVQLEHINTQHSEVVAQNGPPYPPKQNQTPLRANYFPALTLIPRGAFVAYIMCVLSVQSPS